MKISKRLLSLILRLFAIIEIVSPSSIRMDKLIKFSKYEEAGVKEYWIVEQPIGKLVSVFVLREEKYGRPEIYTDEDKVKTILKAAFSRKIYLIGILS